MSSSSSKSATRRSSSYTYGVPGSQVAISLNKSGNHSLTLSRGPNPNSKTSSSVPAYGKPFCKVCYDAGLPVADYTDHFVKDQPGPGGIVVCPTLLAQKCFKCGVAGHTSSYCPEEARREREQKERERETRRVNANDVNGWKVVGGGNGATGAIVASPPSSIPIAAPLPIARGSFGLLAIDDSPSSDEEQVHKPVIVVANANATTEPTKPLTWAQRAAAAATSSKSSITSTPHLNDTRFQLHSLCDRVEMSKRASSAKKVTAASAANHRGNAAAIARDSSLKRKQESVTIPA